MNLQKLEYCNKMSMTKFFKVLIFLSLLITSFMFIQKIFIPSRDYPDFFDYQRKTVFDFFNLKKNSIDAVFIGTSHVYEEISPLQIYNETGIQGKRILKTLKINT